MSINQCKCFNLLILCEIRKCRECWHLKSQSIKNTINTEIFLKKKIFLTGKGRKNSIEIDKEIQKVQKRGNIMHRPQITKRKEPQGSITMVSYIPSRKKGTTMTPITHITMQCYIRAVTDEQHLCSYPLSVLSAQSQRRAQAPSSSDS